MKKADVKIGSTYAAKVSDKLTAVRIDEEHPQGGWNATNMATGKKVRLKSAHRLRGPAPSASDYKPLKDASAEKTRKEALKSIEANLADDNAAAQADSGDTAATGAKGGKKRAPGTPKAKDATRAKRGDDKAGPQRRGILDVAADILAKSKEPMGCKEIVEKAMAGGQWKTTGKTPQATLYAAIIREIQKKGDEARFIKVDRGTFQARKGA